MSFMKHGYFKILKCITFITSILVYSYTSFFCVYITWYSKSYWVMVNGWAILSHRVIKLFQLYIYVYSLQVLNVESTYHWCSPDYELFLNGSMKWVQIRINCTEFLDFSASHQQEKNNNKMGGEIRLISFTFSGPGFWAGPTVGPD